MNKYYIHAIQTNLGFFIKGYHNQISDYNCIDLSIFLFDGNVPEKTFHPRYYFIKNKPIKISRLVNQAPVNLRWQLINETLTSPLIPLVLRKEDVCPDDEGEWTKYQDLQSLYSHKSDAAPPKEEEIEFEFKIIFTIDKIEQITGFEYETFKTKWDDDRTRKLTKEEISTYDITKILFPDIIVPSKPCFLSSKQSFDIVRFYIKQNINPKYAKITSDYDFSFEVAKVISLTENESYLVDVSGLKSKKPKYEQRYRKSREVKIFSMTHSENPWQNLPVFPGFKGNSHKHLKQIIDTFLKELIAKVNEPLEDCSCCKGLGVVHELIDANKLIKN